MFLIKYWYLQCSVTCIIIHVYFWIILYQTFNNSKTFRYRCPMQCNIIFIIWYSCIWLMGDKISNNTIKLIQKTLINSSVILYYLTLQHQCDCFHKPTQEGSTLRYLSNLPLMSSY